MQFGKIEENGITLFFLTSVLVLPGQFFTWVPISGAHLFNSHLTASVNSTFWFALRIPIKDPGKD